MIPGLIKRMKTIIMVNTKPINILSILQNPKSLKSKIVPFKKSEIPLPTVGFSKY